MFLHIDADPTPRKGDAESTRWYWEEERGVSYSAHVLLALGLDFGIVLIPAADVGDVEAWTSRRVSMLERLFCNFEGLTG